MASETLSVDKSETVAVVVSNSELVTPSVKSTMNSQKKTKKSKTKVKAAVAVVAATQEISEAEHLSNLTVDHPYLSVLYKRIRSHRKKLEKIKGLKTAQQQEGKKLNAQQIELMGNKASLEKLVVELEMLREQFIGVFSEEMEQKKKKESEEVIVAVEEVAEKKEEVEEVQEQEETVGELQVETENIQEEIEQKKEDFTNVFELLKTLHLVNLHQALGKEVPMVLDFFSKVLLGNTRPPAELSYEENLLESLGEAKKYLTDSDKVFACDTTYSGLRAFVDELASISSGKNEKPGAAEEESAEQVADEVEDEASSVPVVPAEINTMPQISFFTDSQLESEHGDEALKVEKDEVAESQVEETVIQESEVNAIEQNEVQTEQVEVPVEAPPAPESVPAPPLSFAAVTAGATTATERTPSPSTSSGSSGNDKKEPNSPRKNSRRRGQGRWREKGSNSNSGNKSGNGSPTDGGKSRRSRAPRTNDENSGSQGGKRSGSKEVGRPRVDRGLRKPGNSTQQHATPMIAPHA